MNPKCSHIAGCEWLAREIALKVEQTDGAPRNARDAVSRLRRVKSSDVVDVFLPRSPVSFVAAESRHEAGKVDSYEAHSDRGLMRRRSDNFTTADFLETVVSVYELLEPEERREARLRIAFGPRLPYSKAFCQIQHYFATRGKRIYHGGVCVRLHGPNFSVRFFDRIVPGKGADGEQRRDVSLYLKRDSLLKHWNGKFVIAQLTEAAQPASYAHCYFYGRLIPHPKFLNRLTVEFETLEQIVFAVRRKR